MTHPLDNPRFALAFEAQELADRDAARAKMKAEYEKWTRWQEEHERAAARFDIYWRTSKL